MRTALLIASASLVLLTGCIDDELVSPLGGQGGGGQGGSGASPGPGGSGGDGGGGGEPAPGRGDPATFPTTCVETCEEACTAVVDCGGDSSPSFPIEHEECLSRCQLSQGGPLWDDVSANFRCCASQTECGAVAQCGGWLKHPDTVEPCGKVCECFLSASLDALNAGHSAPDGYRFAPDLVTIDPYSPSESLAGIDATSVWFDGPAKVVKIDGRHERASTLAELASRGRLLPTFVDGTGRVAAANGRVVVKVEDLGARARADGAAAKLGLARTRKLKLGEVYVYETADAFRALDALGPLNAQAGVTAELDLIRHYETRGVPNDPLFPDQWHLHNVGQRDSFPGVDVRITEAWDLTTGDPEVILAINDDGVDLDHPDFAGRLEPELNFPSDWQDLMAQGLFGGHGTSVAGVAAASGGNAFAGVGACPDCRILPHLLAPSTVTGQFQATELDIADGFVEQVDAGAWIISNSWGPATGEPEYVESFQAPPLAMVVEEAFGYAETNGRGGLGTVILFAAGNSNDFIDEESGYPSVITVGAVDNLGLKSWYSSFGPELDVGAPSNGGLAGITTTAIFGLTTDEFGGTSSACPLTAGVVGLVLSANKTLTAAEVRALLGASASPIDPVFGDWQSGHSDYYGAGLVNAYAAVATAAGVCADPTDCLAPSDQCAPGECDRTLCEPCRVDADCADEHVCQSLPTLGLKTCVPAKGASPCPSGTLERAGYCLPTRETCGLCTGGDACNGRDDDCDGEIDDGGACGSGPRCFVDGLGCAEGMVCAGTRCVATCASDDDCSADAICVETKDQLGAATGVKGCVATLNGQCGAGCEVLASSVDDETLDEFVTCMEDAGCNGAFSCVQKLPISF